MKIFRTKEKIDLTGAIICYLFLRCQINYKIVCNWSLRPSPSFYLAKRIKNMKKKVKKLPWCAKLPLALPVAQESAHQLCKVTDSSIGSSEKSETAHEFTYSRTIR